MTIPKPFTQREVDARGRLGFGPTRKKPVRCPDCDRTHVLSECPHQLDTLDKSEQQPLSIETFDESVKLLMRQRHSRIKNDAQRKKCLEEIAYICCLYVLERLAES